MCSASRKPAPARRRPSACRCCSVSPGTIASRIAPQSARALILAPTRELALQIGDSLRTYGRHLKLRHAVILGGVNQNKQVSALRGGVDILVATPGRLLDLVEQKHVRLNAVSVLVIDEADRMFDMGFIRDVRRIVSLVPRKRQSLLFSATMPHEVAHLVAEILHRSGAHRCLADDRHGRSRRTDASISSRPRTSARCCS